MEIVLVTGAGGFIGFNLVKELSNRGFYIYSLIEKNDVIGRDKLSSISNVVIIDDFDLLCLEADKYSKFDLIFHLATVGVRPEFDDINAFCDINIKMSCKLVDIAIKNKSGRIINFGSCFEYGDHNGKLLTETMECYPESLYAISKNCSVKLATQYAKNKDVDLINVRPFGIFGIGEGPNRLAPLVIHHGLEGKELEMTSGEQVRDFVNVKDIVKSVIELSKSDKVGKYEIYNICSNNPIKVKDFIMEIIDVCNFDKSLFKFGAIPNRGNEAMFFAGDNTKLNKIINYDFPMNHREGIIELLNVYKKRGG